MEVKLSVILEEFNRDDIGNKHFVTTCIECLILGD